MDHKIGFRTSGLTHLPLKEVLDGIVQAGFQTVEFCLEHPEASSSTLEFARKSGLEISSVSYHGKRDDPFTRSEMGRRAVRIAEECSVPVVVLGSPLVQSDYFPDETARLYEMCIGAGIRPAWETEPGTVLDGLDEFRRFIVPLGPGAGINLDAGHLHIQNRCTVPEISSLRGRILHVHVEGMNRSEHRHIVPGTGDLNWHDLFTGLSMAGYTGSLTVDLFDIPANWREYLKQANVALVKIMGYM
ncbi:MAG: sugar phosphate isomerase/epimerase [Candidatus Fermentibacteria bacterium]|nr:sugar phosphate isomerase/epimerase [Candidatus Fermentibacteria bacterium]